MAKFIKSVFTSEKRHTSNIVFDDNLEGDGPPPLDDRRKLSMSRSGRLKHSYKKRQQLSVAVYGGEDLHVQERPKSLEYHVNKAVTPTLSAKQPKDDSQPEGIKRKIERSVTPTDLEKCNGTMSPEEEIDSAFEILDKS